MFGICSAEGVQAGSAADGKTDLLGNLGWGFGNLVDARIRRAASQIVAEGRERRRWTSSLDFDSTVGAITDRANDSPLERDGSDPDAQTDALYPAGESKANSVHDRNRGYRSSASSVRSRNASTRSPRPFLPPKRERTSCTATAERPLIMAVRS